MPIEVSGRIRSGSEGLCLQWRAASTRSQRRLMSEFALWILKGRAAAYGLWPADMRDERLVLCPGDLLSDPEAGHRF